MNKEKLVCMSSYCKKKKNLRRWGDRHEPCPGNTKSVHSSKGRPDARGFSDIEQHI